MSNDWKNIHLEDIEVAAMHLRCEGYPFTSGDLLDLYIQLCALRDKQTKEVEKKIPAVFKPIPKEENDKQ